MSLFVLQAPEITLLLPRRSGLQSQNPRVPVIEILSLLEKLKLLLGQGCRPLVGRELSPFSEPPPLSSLRTNSNPELERVLTDTHELSYFTPSRRLSW